MSGDAVVAGISLLLDLEKFRIVNYAVAADAVIVTGLVLIAENIERKHFNVQVYGFADRYGRHLDIIGQC